MIHLLLACQALDKALVWCAAIPEPKLAMPKHEVEARMRYVREVAPLLMYGGDGREDAPQMLIEQLQSRFGRRHT